MGSNSQIKRWTTSFAAAALLLAATARAQPVIFLESDWGTLFVEGRFEGRPEYWSAEYEGPVWGGPQLRIDPEVYDEFGVRSAMTVIARVWEPAGDSSIGAFTTIQPSGTGTYRRFGWAHVDATWRFTVGDENAQFSANAEGSGGDSSVGGFTLFDETTDALVAELREGPGWSVSGLLLGNHEYSMNFFSESGISGSGDPYGNFEFRTNARIVPEPATVVLLSIIALLPRRTVNFRRNT